MGMAMGKMEHKSRSRALASAHAPLPGKVHLFVALPKDIRLQVPYLLTMNLHKWISRDSQASGLRLGLPLNLLP